MEIKIENLATATKLAGVIRSQCRVRRATIDDLKGLVELWQAMGFPANELERRLTEFQVVLSPEGVLLGTVALEISGKQGRIHHEAFGDFSHADPLRPLLWERLLSVATNHGLFRLWTQEQPPFYRQNGLQPADAGILPRLPTTWGALGKVWFTLQLRDEAAIEAISLDKEFALFMESEKQRTARAFQQAKTLKMAATFLAVILAIVVLIALVMLLRHRGLQPASGGN